MSIAKQVIILCMLLYNNAGFTTLNLPNIQQDIIKEVEIQQSNQKLPLQLQKELLQTSSYVITQHNQETKDLNQSIEANYNQNLLIQQGQSQDIGSTQILIGEDYQVISFANPQELKTQASDESQNQSQQNASSETQNFNNKQFNTQDENNLQQDVLNVNTEEVNYDEEAGYVNDSPLDIDLINNPIELNKSLNNSKDQRNQEQPLMKSINSQDNVTQDQDEQYKQNEFQKLNQGKRELVVNQSEDISNKQNVEESLNENQTKKNSLNDQYTQENQESNINGQQEISNKLQEQRQNEQTYDSLKVGYIVENNVETDNYLKDLQESENHSQKQEQVLQQKLEQEEQYLKQLKIKEHDDENKISQLKEQEKLVYDSEQNEQYQIKQINEQFEIHQQEIQQIESNIINESTTTESEIDEQTQFRPYEGQELIISSEVNYDEGNIEQFEQAEQAEQAENNQVIEEKAETLVLQNDEQNEFNWNQNKQYQETFGQSNYLNNSEKENDDVQNFDQSIPAQPQEVSIDLNLKSNDLKSQINLSEDVLITANEEQAELDQSIIFSLVDHLNKNENEINPNSENQIVNLENQNENSATSNAKDNVSSNKKDNQDLDQNSIDEDNQIINFEDYNQQSNDLEQNQIISINSEITLIQNNNSDINNKDQSIQPENILIYQQQNYHNQIKSFNKDLSFYQIQQLIKRPLTQPNLRGSIQEVQDVIQPSLFFEKNERYHNDQYVEDTNHSQQIKQNIKRSIEILNQNNEMKIINIDSEHLKEQIKVTLEGNDFSQPIDLFEEYENLQHIKK